MNTSTTLPTAILQFAYTGVFGPHLRSVAGYAAPKPVSASPRVFLSPRA